MRVKSGAPQDLALLHRATAGRHRARRPAARSITKPDAVDVTERKRDAGILRVGGDRGARTKFVAMLAH
jgi:hypothetical protein